jgi:hypothetical protein
VTRYPVRRVSELAKKLRVRFSIGESCLSALRQIDISMKEKFSSMFKFIAYDVE